MEKEIYRELKGKIIEIIVSGDIKALKDLKEQGLKNLPEDINYYVDGLYPRFRLEEAIENAEYLKANCLMFAGIQMHMTDDGYEAFKKYLIYATGLKKEERDYSIELVKNCFLSTIKTDLDEFQDESVVTMHKDKKERAKKSLAYAEDIANVLLPPEVKIAEENRREHMQGNMERREFEFYKYSLLEIESKQSMPVGYSYLDETGEFVHVKSRYAK